MVADQALETLLSKNAQKLHEYKILAKRHQISDSRLKVPFLNACHLGLGRKIPSSDTTAPLKMDMRNTESEGPKKEDEKDSCVKSTTSQEQINCAT